MSSICSWHSATAGGVAGVVVAGVVVVGVVVVGGGRGGGIARAASCGGDHRGHHQGPDHADGHCLTSRRIRSCSTMAHINAASHPIPVQPV